MSTVFCAVLNMSITGGLVALAVVLIRLLLKRAPRWIVCALWIPVFLRFAIPFSFSSPVSLLGGVGVPAPVQGVVTYLPSEGFEPAVFSKVNAQNAGKSIVAGEAAGSGAADTAHQPDKLDSGIGWMQVAAIIWVVGAAGLIGISMFRYWKLKRLVRDAVMLEPGVYETDAVESPFVIGFFRPHIILPLTLRLRDRELVLRHERAHIHRYDYVTKPVAFLILAMHWFHPLAWLSYRLLCDDMEASCDERAIRDYSREEITCYGEALLALGTQKSALTFGPLAFGEHCTKERIVNVLNYKKPVFWVVAVALVAAITTAIALLANPIAPMKLAIEPKIDKMQQTDFDLGKMSLVWTTSDGKGKRISLEKGLPDAKATLECSGSIDNLLSYSVDPSVLGASDQTSQRLTGFLERLANGQMYIRAYLEQNAKGCYDAEAAQRMIDYSVQNQDVYSYFLDETSAKINIGDYYWHCAQYQVFLILHPYSLHWQHFGYAQYLGSVLNPYDMWLQKINERGVSVDTFGNYAQPYLDHGGNAQNLSNDDYRMLVDSVAYECLKSGMNWGTPYESYPITKIYGFTEPAEQGDDMSVTMASSFCAYLAEHYGFDRLTSYCSGQMTFKEAFQISFDRAYATWEKGLIKEFS